MFMWTYCHLTTPFMVSPSKPNNKTTSFRKPTSLDDLRHPFFCLCWQQLDLRVPRRSAYPENQTHATSGSYLLDNEAVYKPYRQDNAIVMEGSQTTVHPTQCCHSCIFTSTTLAVFQLTHHPNLKRSLDFVLTLVEL
jgi:hypothetical protein